MARFPNRGDGTSVSRNRRGRDLPGRPLRLGHWRRLLLRRVRPCYQQWRSDLGHGEFRDQRRPDRYRHHFNRDRHRRSIQDIVLSTGAASGGTAGVVRIEVGSTTGAMGTDATLKGGDSLGSSPAFTGGSVYVYSGYSAAATSGNVKVFSVNAGESGTSGYLSFATGIASSAGNSGKVSLSGTGAATQGAGGNIDISVGAADTGGGGVYLSLPARAMRNRWAAAV